MKLGKFKLGWGWRYIDASIVVMGMAIAILVWFIPSIDSNPEMQAYMKRAKQITENNKRILAEQARIKKEEEELGIIWVPPPKDLVVPKAAPAAPPAKPAPAKKPQ
jgi:hypothetical protein